MYGLTEDDKNVVQGIISEIESTHWVQRFYRFTFRKTKDRPEAKVCHCLVGHVNVACGIKNQWTSSGKNTKNAQRERIIHALNLGISRKEFWVTNFWSNGFGPASAIENFNDHHSTDKKKVVRLLKRISQ